MGSGSMSLLGQTSLKLLCAEFNECDCHLPGAGGGVCAWRWMESLIDLDVAPGERSENQSRMWNQSSDLFIEQAVPLSWWSDQRGNGNICSIWLPQIKTHVLAAWKRKLIFLPKIPYKCGPPVSLPVSSVQFPIYRLLLSLHYACPPSILHCFLSTKHLFSLLCITGCIKCHEEFRDGGTRTLPWATGLTSTKPNNKTLIIQPFALLVSLLRTV